MTFQKPIEALKLQRLIEERIEFIASRAKDSNALCELIQTDTEIRLLRESLLKIEQTCTQVVIKDTDGIPHEVLRRLSPFSMSTPK